MRDSRSARGLVAPPSNDGSALLREIRSSACRWCRCRGPPQHPDQHLRVAPELADPVGRLEIGETEDVNEFGASRRRQGLERVTGGRRASFDPERRCPYATGTTGDAEEGVKTRPDCPRCGSDLVGAPVTDTPSEWIEELRGGTLRPTAVVDPDLNWLCRTCGHRWQQPPHEVGDTEDIDVGREPSADPPPMRQYVELLKLGPQRPIDLGNGESTLKPLPDPRRHRLVVGAAMTVLALAGIVALALQSQSSDPNSGLPESGQTPIDVQGSEPVSPSPTVRPEPRGLRAVLQVEQLCWVRVIADGEVIEARTLAPGDTAVYRAKREVQLRLGNAGGVTLRVNSELVSTGGSGEVVDLQLAWREGEVLIERA
jgi:hypothetical protein